MNKRLIGALVVLGAMSLLSGCGTTPAATNAIANNSMGSSLADNSTNSAGAFIPVVNETILMATRPEVVLTPKHSSSTPKKTTTTKKTTTHHTTTSSMTTTTSSKATTTSSKSGSTTSSNSGSTGSKSTSGSGNTSSGSGGTSTPTQSDVITQYVHLPFSGNPPSSLTTVKMEYNKSTGAMEAFLTGLSESSYWMWEVDVASPTLYYSNNGGGSWLTAQKGVQYASIPEENGVSYTPNLVLKANTTVMAIGLGNYSGTANGVTGGAVPQGTFKVTYSGGSFAVTQLN